MEIYNNGSKIYIGSAISIEDFLKLHPDISYRRENLEVKYTQRELDAIKKEKIDSVKIDTETTISGNTYSVLRTDILKYKEAIDISTLLGFSTVKLSLKNGVVELNLSDANDVIKILSEIALTNFWKKHDFSLLVNSKDSFDEIQSLPSTL